MSRAAAAVALLALLAGGTAAAQDAPERYVGAVHFAGNRALDDYTLAAGISTSPSSTFYRWFRIGDRRAWDELEFRRDVLRLQLLYRQHGYYEARVDTTVDRSDQLVDVTFQITEGPPVLVDSVTVTGVDSVPGAGAFVHWIPLQPGRPFDRFLFEASADSILFGMRDRGYPFADVFRNYTVHRRERTAEASFDVLAGPRARIGAIDVIGNEKIRSRTIRQVLSVRPGDLYRQNALFDSQRSLYQTELFRYASVGLAPDSTVGGADSLVRVRVQVAEATPVQLRGGLGYGTIDCVRASGTVSALNFVGEGRRLDVVGRVSKIGVGSPTHLGFENSICRELSSDPFSNVINYLGSVTFTQPVALLRRSTLALSTFAERRSEFNAYLVESFGGSFAVRLGVTRRIPVNLVYRLSRDRTSAEPATYCIYFDQCDPATLAPFAAPRRQASLTLSAASNRTDSPLLPTRGYKWNLEATSASPLLGSQVVFDRAVAEAVVYRPLSHKVLSARLRGGIIRQGRSQIGDSTLRYVPPTDRFYAGGPTTVRGFARNEMGPLVYIFDTLRVQGTDTTYVGLRSSPIGSSALVLGNVELRLPTGLFGGRVDVNAFVDAGELWNFDGTRYNAGGIKVTPGLGIQVNTALGPMRVDAAYNGYRTEPGRLYQISGTNLDLVTDAFPGRSRSGTFLARLQWHFNVGLAF